MARANTHTPTVEPVAPTGSTSCSGTNPKRGSSLDRVYPVPFDAAAYPGRGNAALHVYDQPHVLNAVGSYRLGRGWEIGARWRYISGFLYRACAGGLFDNSIGYSTDAMARIRRSPRASTRRTCASRRLGLSQLQESLAYMTSSMHTFTTARTMRFGTMTIPE
jgi:hypothetical protein